MKLCLEMIRDRLSAALPIIAEHFPRDPMDIERFELLDTRIAPEPGVLYLVLPACAGEWERRDCAHAAAILLWDEPAGALPDLRYLQLSAGTDLTFLVNLISRVFFEYATLEQQLQQAVNNDLPLQQFTDLMIPYLDNSITITNPEFRLLAESHSPGISREILDAMPTTEDRRMPPEIVNFMSLDENYIQAKAQREPFFYEARIFPWRTLCINIIHQDEFVARVCVSENQRPLRSYDIELVRLLASYLQLIYNNAHPQDHGVFPQDHLAEVVTNLLDGKNVDTWRIQSCLLRLGWEGDGSFVCASLLPGGNDQAGHTLSYFARQISSTFHGCFAMERQARVFMLINLRCYEDSIDRFVATHIETIRDSFFRIGFSQTFSDLGELHPRYTQAELALSIGLTRQPQIWLHYFSDCALYYMLSSMTDQLEGKYLSAPEVTTLARYDKENNTELLQTLRVYLDHHMNAVQSANALFIHRATMIYRLGRIRELTRLDFDDSERVLWILLTFRLMEHLEQ